MKKNTTHIIMLLITALLSACIPGEDILDSGSDAVLSGVTFSEGVQLNRTFDPKVTNYSAQVPADFSSVDVRPVVNKDGLAISVNGIDLPITRKSAVVQLAPGNNSIFVSVKNLETNNQTTYIFSVTRAESLGPKLSNLKLTEGTLSPAFSMDQLEYNANVSYSVESLSVIPTGVDDKSSIFVNGQNVTSGGASSELSLTVGTTAVDVEVKSHLDGTSNLYAITITREEQPQLSNDASLKSLMLSPLQLDTEFDSEVTQYTGTVSNDITQFAIIPIAQNSTSTITINSVEVDSGNSVTFDLLEGVNLFSMQVTAEDQSTIKTYLLTITRLLNNNANLASLTLSSVTISPSFSKFINNYSARVDTTISSTDVTAIADYSGATVTVNGLDSPTTVALAEGDNTIDVKVISHDGSTTKNYVVNIYREPLGNADLSKIEVPHGQLSPVFNRLTTAYSVTVSNSVASFYVKPTVLDPSSTIKVQGVAAESGKPSQILPLVIGSNEIEIQVTSGNALVTKSYIVDVVRTGSSNTALASLELSSGSVSRDYDAGPTIYTATVAYPVSTMSVTPTVVDPKASVTVNGDEVISGTASIHMPLLVGSDNIFNILVAAEDGTQTNYKITVTRQGSSNANLSNLVLSSGAMDQTFDSALANYTQIIANGTLSLTVTPTAEENSSQIKVNDVVVASGAASSAINLVNGVNTIHVDVTAADNSTTKRYSISVEKHASNNANLKDLTLSTSSLTTAFSKNVTAYNAEVEKPTATITVTPTVEAIGATVKVNGFSVTSGSPSSNIALSVGTNTITVEVTSVDTTTTKTYTVDVERLQSKITNLSSLVISSGTLTPPFDAAETSYTAIVDNSVTSITTTPTLEDITSSQTVNTVTVASGATSSAMALNVGNDNVINVLVTAEDGIQQKNYSVRVRRLQSTNADLSALSVPGVTISPAFDPAITAYTSSVRYSDNIVNVQPTVADSTATKILVNNVEEITSGSLSSNITLPYVGNNAIPVEITAEDISVTKTYTITISRQAASTEARLSNLVLSAGTLSQTFDPAILNYTGNIGNVNTTVDVTPTLWDSYGSVTVNGITAVSGSPVTIDLVEGSNTITVVAKAENNSTTKTYAILLTRALSSDASLSSLVTDNLVLSPAFDSATFSYSATVTNLDTDVTITPVPNHYAAKSVVNGITANPNTSFNLDVGANTINVVVTSQDTTASNTYTISLTRPADGAATNADLSDLSLSYGHLDSTFDSATTTYSTTVSYASSAIQLIPTKSDPAATITVGGVDVVSGKASQLISIAEGSSTPVTVVVTAGDGSTTKTYTVNITRESSSAFAQRAYIKASNAGHSDNFGLSVALSKDTLVVGAIAEDWATNSGAVYVYVRDQAGNWTEEAIVRQTVTDSYDNFGRAVAIEGDLMVVSAIGEDSNITGPVNAFAFPPTWTNDSVTSSGAVYVFKRTSGVWEMEAFIKAINTGSGDMFGASLALSGNTLAVGAPYENGASVDDPNDLTLNNSGAVYTYNRTYDSGSTSWIWSFDKYHKAPAPQSTDFFGVSLALDKDTLVVGASGESGSGTGINPQADTNSSKSGAVYVYTRYNGTWSDPIYIKAAETDSSDYFGESVDLLGDTLIVGAPGEDSADAMDDTNDASANSGAAYIFVRNGTNWSQQAYLKPTYTGANYFFGQTVAVSNNYVIIGQPRNSSSIAGINGSQSDTGALYSGAVYLFKSSAGVWTEDKFIKSYNITASDYFGGHSSIGSLGYTSIAADGDSVAVGAYLEDGSTNTIQYGTSYTHNNSYSSAGAVYTFK